MTMNKKINYCSNAFTFDIIASILLLWLAFISTHSSFCHGYSAPRAQSLQPGKIPPPGKTPSFNGKNTKGNSISRSQPLFFTDYENISGVTRPYEKETMIQNQVNGNPIYNQKIKKGTPLVKKNLFFADELGDSKSSNMMKQHNHSYETIDAKSNSQNQNVETSNISFRKPSFVSRKLKNTPTSLFFADELVNPNIKDDETKISNSNTKLEVQQELARPIASSFEPRTYNPHPLLSNEHLQTILGVFVRDEPGCAYIDPNAKNIIEELLPISKALLKKLPNILGFGQGESSCDYWDERERVRTNDGDFFDVDYKYVKSGNSSHHNEDNTLEASEGMVIIVHGLESNSNSSVCVNLAKSFQSHNFDVACINFRGCSGEPNDSIYQYHGGFTDDLTHFIKHLSDRRRAEEGSDIKPLYISGFSLGANIVMKCIGELSIDAVEKYNIKGAAVTAAPFHLRPHHRRLIDEPFQRIVYAGSILNSMKNKVDYIVDRYCDGNKDTDLFDYWKVKNATTIADVEDGMIAPLYGFKDKFDYFDKSASYPLIERIAVPTYVLNAADDPFFDPTFFPWDKDGDNSRIAPLKLNRSSKGGHLGHLFHRMSDDKLSTQNHENYPVASFALSELGRFINHVNTQSKQL